MALASLMISDQCLLPGLLCLICWHYGPFLHFSCLPDSTYLKRYRRRLGYDLIVSCLLFATSSPSSSSPSAGRATSCYRGAPRTSSNCWLGFD